MIEEIGRRTRSRRRVLDVVAAATRVALDARYVIIAVEAEGSWLIEGDSSATGDGSAGDELRIEGADLGDGEPFAIRLARVAGRWWVRPAPPPASEALSAGGVGQVACLGSTADDHRLLLVIDHPRGPNVADHLRGLLHVARVGMVVEDEVKRERLRESLQEREEERRRWARELHDDTLQQLGALQVLLTSTRRQHETGHDEGLYSAVETATGLLREQIVGLRHLINELRPATLDELGLRPPLEALAKRTEQLTGLQVEMEVSLPYADGRNSTRLLPDIELAIYRVVQEALANAARHSRGTRARVVAVEDKDQIRVEVSDDGQGPGRVAGFGIEGMRERAMLAGGHLEVLSRPGGQGGTLVRLIVPAIHRSGGAGEEDRPIAGEPQD